MLIDCDCCVMKDTSVCDDCVVTALLSPGPIDLTDSEREALDALAEAGLVPRLRLVPGSPTEPPRAAAG
jgi:hypothetical protein